MGAFKNGTGVLDRVRDWQNSEEEVNQFEQAVTALSGVGAIVKADNEALQSMALANPRNIKKIIKEVVEEIELVPEVAEENVYEIRYKDGTVIEGPSIRMAELLQRCYGFMNSGFNVIHEDGHSCTIQGVAIDLQKGNRFFATRHVTRLFVRKDKRTETLNERKWEQKKLAEGAKAQREAILKAIPNSIKRTAYEASIEIAGQVASNNLPGLLEAFAEAGVSKEMLSKWLGRPISQVNAKELGRLRAIYRSLRDNFTTPEEAFANDKDGDPIDAPEYNDNGINTDAFTPQQPQRPEKQAKPEPRTEKKEEPESIFKPVEKQTETENVSSKETIRPETGRQSQETEQPTVEPGRLTITRIREALESGPATFDELKDYLDGENVNTHNLSRSLENYVAKGTIIQDGDFYLLPEQVQAQATEEPETEPEELPLESEPEPSKEIPTKAGEAVTADVIKRVILEARKPLSWKAIADELAFRDYFIQESDLGKMLRNMVKDGVLADGEGGYTIPQTQQPQQAKPKDKRLPKDVLLEVVQLNPGKTVEAIAEIAEDFGLHLPVANTRGLLDTLVKDGRMQTGTTRDNKVLYFVDLKPLILKVITDAGKPIGQPIISRALGIDGNDVRFRSAIRVMLADRTIVFEGGLYHLNS